MNPVFSAVTAKMKSVCGSGKNLSTLWDVSVSPLIPDKPPLPTVIVDWIVWYPYPRGSTLSGSMIANIRSCW
jgi:hypothetical protein